MATKKWYDTWWGLLWTLALVDANPGRGLQTFIEVNKELEKLPEIQEDESPKEAQRPKAPKPIPLPLRVFGGLFTV
jgi:hypothetical protein